MRPGELCLGAGSRPPWCNANLRKRKKLGAMLQLDFAEAQARFGEQLAVASLGAIEKKNGTFRVVHDGTHGVGINPGIKIRDQLKSPCAGDIKAVMQELPRLLFWFDWRCGASTSTSEGGGSRLRAHGLQNWNKQPNLGEPGRILWDQFGCLPLVTANEWCRESGVLRTWEVRALLIGLCR